MDNQLEFLFKQIKEGKMNQEDAVKQIKELKGRINPETLPKTGDDSGIIREVYVYDEPYLSDHTVYDRQTLIGVTYASLGINAFFKFFPHEKIVHLHRMSFIKPVGVERDQQAEVIVEPVWKESDIEFQVMYRCVPSGKWEQTATGSLKKGMFEIRKIDMEGLKGSMEEYRDLDRIYSANPGVRLGDSFKTITCLYYGKEEVLARISLNRVPREESHDYALHPLIINSAYLAMAPLLGQLDIKDGFLPFGIKDIHFQKTGGLENCWLLVKLVRNSGEMIVFDVDVISDESRIVAHFSGCSVKRIRTAVGIHAEGPQASDPEKPGRVSLEGNTYHTDFMEDMGDIRKKIQKYLTRKLGEIMPESTSLSAVETNLMEMGLNSSQLVAVTGEIEKEIKIELNPALFFEYPNIKELTGYLYEEHRDSFIKMMREASGQSEAPRPGRQSNAAVSPKPLKEEAQVRHTGSYAPNPSGAKEEISAPVEDIAVIGMNGMFAGAPDIDRFWENLLDKKDIIKEIPIDHWDYRPWYDENPEAKNKTYCKWGSFIDDVDKFDAEFFNISPREADWMDPQLRLLMQSIYASGEDAGYINRLRGTDTGVFVGVCFHDYADKIAEMGLPVDPYIGTGNGQTVFANRVSFYFDFSGPSIAIDTACSSSLFALHYACQALRNKECSMAFVGGTNLLLSSHHYRYFSSIGALSPTGHCHTFDEAADGYVPGECVASILLKPLRQAKKDGDRIYALIKGSAAMHGGYTPSLTAPSVVGEERVILKAWENAGIDPRTITYIEAHGTGTKLGDPIEINSIKKAFKRFTGEEHFCAVGSVKGNMGHAEGAAGIAGLIKVILQLNHKKIIPLPRFKKLNPYIKLDKSALYISQEVEEWKSPAGVPRHAGINSFGFSGAYAHAVLEEYIPEIPEESHAAAADVKPEIIVLSARNRERLKAQAQRLLTFIEEKNFTDANLEDMAYTLQVGREAMEERLGIIAASMEELKEKLKGFLDNQKDMEYVYYGQVKKNSEKLGAFMEDEDMRAAVQSVVDVWIIKGKYSKLLEFWVKGLGSDWNRLYREHKPSIIYLPSYPFAKQRFWVRGDSSKASGSGAPASLLSPAAAPNHSAVPQKAPDFPKQTIPGTGQDSSNMHGKTGLISLKPLSEEQFSSSERIAGSSRSVQLPSTDALTASPASGKQSGPGAHARDSCNTGTLLEELVASLAEALYMDQESIDIDKQFTDMGLDSIVAVEWIKSINKRYGASVAATRVYDYPCIRQFAGFLAEELDKPGEQVHNSNTPATVNLPSDGASGREAPLPQLLEVQARSEMQTLAGQEEVLREELSASLAEAMFMDRGDIDIEKQFVDMGMDSIIAVEWIKAINKRYGTSVAAARIYDYPCIREFAKFMESELKVNGRGPEQARLKAALPLSEDEIFQKVYQGILDIEQANKLLLKGEGV